MSIRGPLPEVGPLYTKEPSRSALAAHCQFCSQPLRLFCGARADPVGPRTTQLSADGENNGVGVKVAVGVGVRVMQRPESVQRPLGTGLQPPPQMPLTGGPQAG